MLQQAVFVCELLEYRLGLLIRVSRMQQWGRGGRLEDFAEGLSVQIANRVPCLTALIEPSDQIIVIKMLRRRDEGWHA